MNDSVTNLTNEINLYIKNLVNENRVEYVKYLLNPRALSIELHDFLEAKKKLEKELANYYELSFRYANNPFEESNTKLELVLNRTVDLEIGVKDEFETTNEFQERKKAKLVEIKSNYLQYSHVRGYVEELIEEVNINIRGKKKEIGALERKINDLKLIMNRSSFDLNSVLACYYKGYERKIELGPYNADDESFLLKVNQVEKKVKVSRRIAKDFKLYFNDLSPQYKATIQRDSIHHFFVYEIGGEQVELPFLVTSRA